MLILPLVLATSLLIAAEPEVMYLNAATPIMTADGTKGFLRKGTKVEIVNRDGATALAIVDLYDRTSLRPKAGDEGNRGRDPGPRARVSLSALDPKPSERRAPASNSSSSSFYVAACTGEEMVVLGRYDKNRGFQAEDLAGAGTRSPGLIPDLPDWYPLSFPGAVSTHDYLGAYVTWGRRHGDDAPALTIIGSCAVRGEIYTSQPVRRATLGPVAPSIVIRAGETDHRGLGFGYEAGLVVEAGVIDLRRSMSFDDRFSSPVWSIASKDGEILQTVHRSHGSVLSPARWFLPTGADSAVGIGAYESSPREGQEREHGFLIVEVLRKSQRIKTTTVVVWKILGC